MDKDKLLSPKAILEAQQKKSSKETLKPPEIPITPTPEVAAQPPKPKFDQIIGFNRPPPPSKTTEQGSVIVAKALAPQMGTSPEMLSNMEIDEFKFGVLDEGTLCSLSHFDYRARIDGIRYWGHFVPLWLRGSQGVSGLARRHVIQLHANTSGVQNVETAKKPNALARNLWNRNWKEKAESKGEIVDE